MFAPPSIPNALLIPEKITSGKYHPNLWFICSYRGVQQGNGRDKYVLLLMF